MATDDKRSDKTCFACAHSYMEPGENLTCGHAKAGIFGRYVEDGGRPPINDCGPTRSLFKQHPLRNANGTLKQVAPDA